MKGLLPAKDGVLISPVFSLSVLQALLLKTHGDDHFLVSDMDSAAGFEETAERGVGIADVANDFAGHFQVVVTSP